MKDSVVEMVNKRDAVGLYGQAINSLSEGLFLVGEARTLVCLARGYVRAESLREDWQALADTFDKLGDILKGMWAKDKLIKDLQKHQRAHDAVGPKGWDVADTSHD